LATARPASAAAASPTPLTPSGDTTGATDYSAIQSILDNGYLETAVLLGSGTFYVNQTITFKSSQQAIRGQGRNITVVEAVADFSGTSVIYTGSDNQFLTVDSLTIAGPATGDFALNGSSQLNGLQQTGSAIRSQFTNLHVHNLNGYPFIFDGQGGNNAGTLVANLLADNCAGVCYLQGNVGGYRGSATFMNVGGVNTPTVTSGPMAGQPAFLVQDYEDLLGWTSTPSHIAGTCASCFFYSIDTGVEILLSDDSEGAPSDIGFFGGIVEADAGNQCGIRITGAAQQVWIHDLKIAYNTNHGISVEGTGNQIQIRNCQFQNNGQLESGTTSASYFDLNWSGTASGLVHDCIFNTTIEPAGTSGVVASVNMTAGLSGVYFADCQFPQSGVTGTLFTHTPTTVRDCIPYNPVGKVTVSVPASGNSTTALPCDTTFYIAANSSSSCTATVTGSAVTIPEGSVVPVFVPAGVPLKLSYSKAPTWTVNGD
ncbi:MAG: hypothetical protein ACRDN0_05885, partial [Trebonia sp.]